MAIVTDFLWPLLRARWHDGQKSSAQQIADARVSRPTAFRVCSPRGALHIHVSGTSADATALGTGNDVAESVRASAAVDAARPTLVRVTGSRPSSQRSWRFVTSWYPSPFSDSQAKGPWSEHASRTNHRCPPLPSAAARSRVFPARPTRAGSSASMQDFERGAT